MRYYRLTRCGIPMEDALTPEQCNVVSSFLNSLITYNDKNPEIKHSALVAEYLRLFRKAISGQLILNRKSNIDKEKVNRMIELRKCGLSFEAISEKCGVSTSMAWTYTQNVIKGR